MLWPTELKRHSFQSSPGLSLSLRCSSVPFAVAKLSTIFRLRKQFHKKTSKNFFLLRHLPLQSPPYQLLTRQLPSPLPPSFFSPSPSPPSPSGSFPLLFLPLSALSCPFPPFPPLSSPFPLLFLSLSSLSAPFLPFSSPFPPLFLSLSSLSSPFPPFPLLSLPFMPLFPPFLPCSRQPLQVFGMKSRIAPKFPPPRPRLPLSLFTLFIFINHAFFIIFASA